MAVGGNGVRCGASGASDCADFDQLAPPGARVLSRTPPSSPPTGVRDLRVVPGRGDARARRTVCISSRRWARSTGGNHDGVARVNFIAEPAVTANVTPYR